MTHTPGPWEYRPEPHDDWGVVRVGRYWICQAKDPAANSDEILAAHREAKTDPWEANARLIAAAPDLLEALEALVKAMDAPRYGDDRIEDDLFGVGFNDGPYSLATAAIARARGETA